MKKISYLLTTVFICFLSINSISQEKKHHLYYCWEETVKPEKAKEYRSLTKEFIELSKEEKSAFTMYTWEKFPLVYQNWIPINTLNDIDKVHDEWRKVIERWGEDKYDAFCDTKLSNRSFTCTFKDELGYDPEKSPFPKEDMAYLYWIEINLKSGKVDEYEKALKWLNEKRKEKGFATYVMYAVGGIGFEKPCVIIAIVDLSKKQHVNRDLNTKMRDEFTEFSDMVRPLISKPAVRSDLYFRKDISYILEEE